MLPPGPEAEPHVARTPPPENDPIADITDTDRKEAAATIASYEKKLSILHTLRFSSRIEGTILVRNTGDRRIKMLELTLSLPVSGQSKIEEQRLLFVDKTGSVAPPKPANPTQGTSALMKVDLPCPSGAVGAELPELQVSYLQFAE